MINLNQRLGQFAPGKDSAARWCCVAALGRLGFDREPHFDGHLVVQDLAAIDVPARFEHFEPADIVDGAGRAGDRSLDRILDAGGGGADELDDFVDMVCHELPSLKMVDAPAYASLGEEPTNAGRPAVKRTGLTSRIYFVTAFATDNQR
jgi:hypothetical protein